jgi:hypothetical protein
MTDRKKPSGIRIGAAAKPACTIDGGGRHESSRSESIKDHGL